MGLGITLIAVSIALVVAGIAVPGIYWLAILGIVLFVLSVGFTAVRGPST